MILATAMLFVITLMIHSHAPVKIATQEMDSLVEVIQGPSGSHEPPAPFDSFLIGLTHMLQE